MILLNIFFIFFLLFIFLCLSYKHEIPESKENKGPLDLPKKEIKKDLVVEDYELRSQKKYKFLLHNLEMDHTHLIQIYEIYLTYLTFSDPDSFLSPRVRNWEGIF